MAAACLHMAFRWPGILHRWHVWPVAAHLSWVPCRLPQFLHGLPAALPSLALAPA